MVGAAVNARFSETIELIPATRATTGKAYIEKAIVTVDIFMRNLSRITGPNYRAIFVDELQMLLC